MYGKVFDHEKFRALIYADGDVAYWTAGKIRTACQVNISYFPFDEQCCYVQVDSWTYTGVMMIIKNVTDGIVLQNYRENGQWDIYKNVTKYNIEGSNDVLYSNIQFELFLHRKPLFMVMTIVLPSIILALLVILVFYLPADAGEKLSLGITLLLSFSVFQLLLADSLPRSSDYTPILCKYALSCFIHKFFV